MASDWIWARDMIGHLPRTRKWRVAECGVDKSPP